MNKEHESDLTIPYVKVGDYCFPNFALFNQEATERLESRKVVQGITEELKGCDQMGWVGAMNNIRASAEEIVYAELVYE